MPRDSSTANGEANDRLHETSLTFIERKEGASRYQVGTFMDPGNAISWFASRRESP